MGHYFNPNIPKDNLHWIVDVANSRSYPGTGTLWKNAVSSGYNNLTNTNTPTYSALGATSNFAYNGSNQYSVNSSLIDPANIQGPITVNIIFSPSSLTGTQNIFSLFNNTGSQSLQIGFDGATGKIWKFGGTALLNYTYAGIGTVWHITYSCDGSNNSKVYINGQLHTSGSVATNTGTPLTYTVGSYATGSGEFFNGKVYYVSIHKKVHTDNEVADTWHALKRRYGYAGIGTNPYTGDPITEPIGGGPE
jgi:hypothetical protein